MHGLQFLDSGPGAMVLNALVMKRLIR